MLISKNQKKNKLNTLPKILSNDVETKNIKMFLLCFFIIVFKIKTLTQKKRSINPIIIPFGI